MRALRTVAAAGFLGLATVFGATWAGAHSAIVPKCKATPHLLVTTASPGSKPLASSKVDVVKVASGACRNDPTYDGTIYVFRIDGKLGLQMFPDGAAYVKTQFTARAGAVTLDHTVTTVLTPYRTFSDAARAKVAAELANEGA